jgi:protoporphyrinogen/coproporphyrinogen III oxidase
VAHPSHKSIAILGAGITGLTAAFRLTQRGHRVRVFEAAPRVGGAVQSVEADGWLSEAGPNTLMLGDVKLAGLLDELGLKGDLVMANTTAATHRFIVRRGRLMAAPTSPGGLLSTPLLSLGAKIRLGAELLQRPRTRLADLSLEDFIRDHFGQEVVDFVLNPLVTGIYAGSPKRLSARYAFPPLWEIEQRVGSLGRGLKAKAGGRAVGHAGIGSFQHGLQQLPDALAIRLPRETVQLSARVEALLPGRSWNVVWNDGATTHTEAFDTLVAALPAPALAQLRMGTLGERPLAALEGIEHPPVSLLFLGYPRARVAHPLDGFGLLVPEVEQRAVLGVLFSSTLFPNRAPPGHVALTVIVGGTRQPELARQDPARILATVQPELRELLGVDGVPMVQRHVFWPRAIPQYNLGYEVHLEAMAAAENAYPGLLIGGQARDGIALPACIAAGERLAAAASR